VQIKTIKETKKIIKNIATIAIMAITFHIAHTTEAAELTVYGKGGVIYGEGTVQVCPEQSTDACATLSVNLQEIKIRGADGKVITIDKDDVCVLIISNKTSDTHFIQGESIQIKLIER